MEAARYRGERGAGNPQKSLAAQQGARGRDEPPWGGLPWVQAGTASAPPRAELCLPGHYA